MAGTCMPEFAKARSWPDERIVRSILDGNVILFEILMRRHNQRIYRAVCSILRNDAECEDVVQETYISAFAHLSQFAGRAKFSTWLIRIAVNGALKHYSTRGEFEFAGLEESEREMLSAQMCRSSLETPEADASRGELSEILEEAIRALPPPYRDVVTLRDLKEMSTEETAEALSLTGSNVRVRLHRARELLRGELLARIGSRRCNPPQTPSDISMRSLGRHRRQVKASWATAFRFGA